MAETSGATINVGCKLPHGIHMDITKHGELRKRVTLSGTNSSRVIGGYGITENVSKEFFDKWMSDHQDLPAVKNGLIFAHGQMASVEAKAKEKAGVVNKFEPINPANPGKELAALNMKD
jgi:hypothetical protein